MRDASVHAKEQPPDIEASAPARDHEEKAGEEEEEAATSVVVVEIGPAPVSAAPAKTLPPWRRRWNAVYAFMDANHLVIALLACEWGVDDDDDDEWRHILLHSMSH